ncbi:MAG: YjgN family protein [Nitrospira sp.]
MTDTTSTLDDVEAPPKNSSPITLGFVFAGNGKSLFGISIVNIFLTFITCGVYLFWGRVRVRRYLFSQTEFAGDRFHYHGTGPELLQGFLKAILGFGIPSACLTWGPVFFEMEAWIGVTANILGVALLLIVIPVATVWARHYRLTRTSWRGIRCSFVGPTSECPCLEVAPTTQSLTMQYLKLYLTGTALSLITVGLYYPFFDARSQAFLVSHSRVGNQSFSFDGKGEDLAKAFYLAALLTPFTLGLSWYWYSARRQRYYWEHTSFMNGRFTFTGTGAELCGVKLGNFFLLVFTLGFAWPWTTIRNVRFVLDHLAFTGPGNFDTLVQAMQLASPTGDGIDSYIDNGIDLS